MYTTAAMADLVDTVTLRPYTYMISMEGPTFLYEKVITFQQEHQLLNKLAAPRARAAEIAAVRRGCKSPGPHRPAGLVAAAAAAAAAAEEVLARPKGGASVTGSSSSSSSVYKSRIRMRMKPEESRAVKEAHDYYLRERATLSVGCISTGGKLPAPQARSGGYEKFLPGNSKAPLRL
ncbi:MAG: hypothetical protein WDW38_001917 [Sanguina aurantia]